MNGAGGDCWTVPWRCLFVRASVGWCLRLDRYPHARALSRIFKIFGESEMGLFVGYLMSPSVTSLRYRQALPRSLHLDCATPPLLRLKSPYILAGTLSIHLPTSDHAFDNTHVLSSTPTRIQPFLSHPILSITATLSNLQHTLPTVSGHGGEAFAMLYEGAVSVWVSPTVPGGRDRCKSLCLWLCGRGGLGWSWGEEPW